jgi:hypothetical protein
MAVLLALCVQLMSCAGQPGAVAQNYATHRALPQALPVLPAPSQLGRDASFVDADRFRDGSAYGAALPHQGVAAEGTALRFSAAWDPPSGATLPAYATYRWSLDGYSGTQRIGLEWGAAPLAAQQVWLGLANWTADRWDWQRLATAASSASLSPLAKYLRADGSIVAAVVVLAKAAEAKPLLNRIFVGGSDAVLPGDQEFTVDFSATGTPVSPLIYGIDDLDVAGAQQAKPGLVRLGGNRWTAYNWENNASNAGTDWFNQNDGYLSSSDTPGEAVRRGVQAAFDVGAASLVTVPIQGYCAADKNEDGDVNATPDYIHARFRQNIAAKGAAFSLIPDTGDAYVYQDEFIHWLQTTFPGSLSAGPARIMLSLDNEPDLWAETHPRIQLAAVSYAALIQKSIEYMLAVRAVAPQAQFFGAVNYGYTGFINLQFAPDAAAHGEFLDYYLDQMHAAEIAYGQRLLNVLDVHWYSEARGGGIEVGGDDVTDPVVEARLQAPRSLWDPTYVEDSWITVDYNPNVPIDLLHWIKNKIAAIYPGTKLSVSEYYYGAGDHISGGLAEADALGIFGREGLFAACEYPVNFKSAYIFGALRLYRNYDGAGGRFGDLALPVGWSDRAGYSAYAARYSGDGSRLALLLINKQAADKLARITLAGPAPGYGTALVYTLSAAGGPAPVAGAPLNLPPGGSFNATLPARSAKLLVLIAQP